MAGYTPTLESRCGAGLSDRTSVSVISCAALSVLIVFLAPQKERFYKTTVSNLVFGVPAKETAFTRIYKRQRFLTYAVTVVLKRNDPE